MKKLCALVLTLILALTAVPLALAEGEGEGLLPYEGDPVTYEGYAADLGITEDRESIVYKAYRERIGDVTIDWSTGPWADYDTKCAMFLNTGDLPDIVWLRDASLVVANYGSMGYFLNLMDYLDYMPNLRAYLEEYPQLEYMKTPDGALYCVNDLEPFDHVDECFFVNTAQLEKLGLEIPKTWDDMLEAMRAFKAENPQSTPFITYGWGLGIYTNYLGSILDAKRGFYYDGEKWNHSLLNDSSGHRDLVGMLATMYQEGLIHPEFSTMSDEQAYQIVIDGDWLFGFWYLNTIYAEIFMRDEVPYEYQPILTPSYREGDPTYQVITVPYDNLPYWGYFISADVENPELMCSLLDFIISKDASTIFNWGVEGVTYDVDVKGNSHYLEGYEPGGELRAESGIGNFMDVRYIMYKMRNTEYAGAGEVAKQAYDLVVGALNDGTATGIRALRATPRFTAEESEAVAAVMTPVNTYIDENIMYFIDNTRPMSEWDAFVEEVLALGDLEGVLEIYENAEQVIYSTVRKFRVYD